MESQTEKEEVEGLYQIEYEIDYGGNTIVWLFGRDEDGNKQIKKVRDFEPYFYVPYDERYDYKGHEIKRIEDDEYKTIFGKSVARIVTRNPKQVGWIRNNYSEHFEADITFHRRYYIDKVKEISKAKLRIIHLDIETLSEHGFPEPENANEKIICITLYDNFADEFVTLIWHDSIKSFNKKQNNNHKIFEFTNEKDMLSAFIFVLNKYQPDIITGWNVTRFDLYYLISRFEKLKIPYRRMSPMGTVYIPKSQGKFRSDPIIKGITLFDLLARYRTIHKGELTSYALNAVAKEELGEEKEEVHYTIDKDFKAGNLDKIISYNKRDVELTVKIDNKTKIIDFFDEIRRLARVNFDDCKYYGTVIDNFVLCYAKNKYILPSKGEWHPKTEEERISGGYVGEVDAKIYENVVVCDISQIYPSLIQTFNLSPETLNEKGEINAYDYRYNKTPKGILPSILDELFKIRTDLKMKMKSLKVDDPDFKLYDMKQQAAKNLICTVYGVNALSSFRLYSKEVAESITGTGRELVKWCNKEIEKLGHKVIYNDTDSTFIQILAGDAFSEGRRITTHLNENFSIFAKKHGVLRHNLSIEFEKIYKRMIISAKKRYAGLLMWKNNKEDTGFEITGFDAKRSDSSLFSRNLQREVLKKILKGDNEEDILQYIKKACFDIKHQHKTEIAIPIKFEKAFHNYTYKTGEKSGTRLNLPRIRAAEWSNKNLGTNFKAGSKVFMLYVDHPDTKEIAFEYDYQFPADMEIDWDKMIEKSIFKKLVHIFETVGWSSGLEILQNLILKKQTSLQSFVKIEQ